MPLRHSGKQRNRLNRILPWEAMTWTRLHRTRWEYGNRP
jgi:hypothetical protein